LFGLDESPNNGPSFRCQKSRKTRTSDIGSRSPENGFKLLVHGFTLRQVHM
jgi:hypothetical protein